MDDGPLDRRLGVGNKSGQCLTCEQTIDRCVGHFGSLDLSLPLYHPMYFKHTLNALKIICKQCSRVLLPAEERQAFLARMVRLEHDYLKRQALSKKVIAESRKHAACESCLFANPKVLKVAKMALRIEMVFEKGKGKADRFELSPLQAYHLLDRVSLIERPLLNLSCHPSELIMRVMPISPVCIRPSLMLQNNQSNEDDLTMKIREIQALNERLKSSLAEGCPYEKLDKDWYLVNALVGQYVNSDMSGLQIKELGKKSIRSLCSRLKGKQGRFRQNLSGKRSNFTARTVISPDPNLDLDQVIVPEFMAKILTVTEQVTPRNRARLSAAVEAGSHARNGANFVITRAGVKTYASFVKSLQVGDEVERHLRDEDLVIFNRQPSLHRISMMGFRVKVKPGNTLRFNECACAPFNADFDGDEMNIHVPQTTEAQAETKHLMGLVSNLMSPKNGEPIVALIQDFITCAFVLTDKQRFLTRH